jgi:hypothetical protein
MNRRRSCDEERRAASGRRPGDPRAPHTEAPQPPHLGRSTGAVRAMRRRRCAETAGAVRAIGRGDKPLENATERGPGVRRESERSVIEDALSRVDQRRSSHPSARSDSPPPGPLTRGMPPLSSPERAAVALRPRGRCDATRELRPPVVVEALGGDKGRHERVHRSRCNCARRRAARAIPAPSTAGSRRNGAARQVQLPSGLAPRISSALG